MSEPRNPFYPLLLIAGLVFTLTAGATAVVPVLEQRAADAGSPPPPSPFRDALRERGWIWTLGALAALVLLGILSMGLDRLRRLQRERAERKIAVSDDRPTSL